MPAGLTVQVTSPRDAGFALGLLIISLHLPRPTGKGRVCTGLFMMRFAQKFLSVNWKISLLSSPRLLQSPLSSAASLGFALYRTPWCAGLGTHPMSSCPSPTALSIPGKSSSSIKSTHVCGFFWAAIYAQLSRGC